MLLLKEGVLIRGNKYTHAIMTAVQTVYESHGWSTVITSGNDSKHGPNSYHAQDRALDIRFWLIPIAQREKIASEIRAKLPYFYDVVVEGDHFHIEADAKKEGLPDGPI